MGPAYRIAGCVARCYTRPVDIWDVARRRLTVESYRRDLMPQIRDRFPKEADAAAEESEATGRTFLDCLPDPWMAFGIRREEVDPRAIVLVQAAALRDPDSFPIEILMRSTVPPDYERILEWLSIRDQPLANGPKFAQFDWSSILSDSLTEREGLPIEALVELGERVLDEDGYPNFSPYGARLAAIYGYKMLGNSDERVEEGHLVYSLMPGGTLVTNAIDGERFPALYKAVHTGRRRRTRERVGLEGFDQHAEEFEALVTGLTPSGSWDAFEYLAHVLDDPWKLIGKRREEMTPGTLMFLENSGGSTLVRRSVALENAANEHVPVWAEWLRGIDDDRDKLWHAVRRIDRDIVTSTLRSLYWSPPSNDNATVVTSMWANQEGSCVEALTAEDIGEMIRRGISAPEAGRLLQNLRSAEAFRLHFYEGMPVEYAVAMVDWPDV